MDTLTETDLLAAWLSGDQEAFVVLVARYQGLVHAACVRQAAVGDVDDCVQATFLVLARRAAAAARVPSLTAWLLRVATFVCRQSRRAAERRRRAESAAAQEAVPTGRRPVEALGHLDDCLLRLPEKQRTAVVMHFLAGESPEAVATALGTSRENAYKLVNRGLAGLRSLLARRGMAMGSAALAGLLASEAQAAAAPVPATLLVTLTTTVTPSAGATAFANGVITAMIIKTATLIAAGLVLASSCVTAALVAGAEPAPTPAAIPAAQPPVPAAPAVAKPAWATDSGKDQYGAWADLKVADVTQRFRWIQPGTFTMGSPQAEKDAVVATDPILKNLVADEVPHPVTLTQGFWLADIACTQALWQAITGSNPSQFKDSPQNPVEQVSWDDCQQFLSNLNDRVSGGGFRLPSEAQWEYACRAGTTTAFNFGSTITPEQVNYNGGFPFGGAAKGLFRQKTVPVKSLPPNAWGLYEMHGNVWQWCNDWNDDYSGSAERDPTGPSSGSYRVLRGGSWGYGALYSRSADRYGNAPDLRNPYLGFRFAAQATPKSSQVQSNKDF